MTSVEYINSLFEEIEELKAQIEAMKNCENCDRVNCWQCKKNDKWSLYVQC